MQETGFADIAAQAIAATVVLPVIRAESADEALAVADWSLEQGLPAVELTATTPGWPDALRALRERSPETVVGVGTLRDGEDARAAADGGATFLVSPVPAPVVERVAAEHGLLMVGGGFTPSELLLAAGAGMAKLFPAHAAGPRFLRSVLTIAPPGTRVVPTGGIALGHVPAWLEAGAFAVGMGSELKPGPETAARLRELRAEAVPA